MIGVRAMSELEKKLQLIEERMKEKLDEERWQNVEEIINFALKVVKFRMRKQESLEDL